jgi:hypothetical protein
MTWWFRASVLPTGIEAAALGGCMDHFPRCRLFPFCLNVLFGSVITLEISDQIRYAVSRAMIKMGREIKSNLSLLIPDAQFRAGGFFLPRFVRSRNQTKF